MRVPLHILNQHTATDGKTAKAIRRISRAYLDHCATAVLSPLPWTPGPSLFMLLCLAYQLCLAYFVYPAAPFYNSPGLDVSDSNT